MLEICCVKIESYMECLAVKIDQYHKSDHFRSRAHQAKMVHSQAVARNRRT